MKKFFKSFCIFTFGFIALLTFLELGSYAVILYKDSEKVDERWQILVNNFPATFLLDSTTKVKLYSYDRKPTGLNNLVFDNIIGNSNLSMLGYYKWENGLQKFIRFKKNKNYQKEKGFWDSLFAHSKGKRIILCLGSSTSASSQNSNWPNPLSRLLQEYHPEKYVVLNFAHNSYGLFHETELIKNWVFNEFYKRGKTIFSAISLDGVTDIAYSAAALNLKRRGEIYWDHRYSATQQIARYKSQHSQTFSNSFQRFRAKNKKIARVFDVFKIFLPTFYGLIHPSEVMKSNRSIFKLLFPNNGYNFVRFYNLYYAVPQSLGAFVPREIVNHPKVAHSQSLNELLKNIQKKNLIKSGQLIQKSLSNFSDVKALEISQSEKEIIFNSIEYRLYIRRKLSQGIVTHSLDFLQPIAKRNRSKSVKFDVPDLSYVLVHWYMRGDILGENLRLDLEFSLKKLAAIYHKLNTKIGNFYNLSNLFDKDPTIVVDHNKIFRDVMTNFKNNELYVFDGIHYTPRASILIAEEIFNKIKLLN